MSRDHHLEALVLARSGDWTGAHELIQTCTDELACLIHAYLHREEGDTGNAGYWYQRAGAQPSHGSLEEEWTRLYELARQQASLFR